MRTRRRIGLLLASAAALGVGLIALPSSAAAAPPAVPACLFPNTAGSDSCATGRTTALVPPIGGAFERVRLGVRVRSRFQPATSETTRVTLRFDDDGRINLTGIPACPPFKVTGKTIAQAYNVCGPAGSQADNAFLSPPGNVSGVGSTVVAGIDACTMIFKGATSNRLTIYARAPIGNPSTECNNPATNSGGSATVVFTGVLSTLPAASPYHHQLTVPNTHTANPSLDDFSATVTRGNAIRARCTNTNPRPFRMQAIWDYTAAGDPNDARVATHLCPH
jgi:hypothetical protein